MPRGKPRRERPSWAESWNPWARAPGAPRVVDHRGRPLGLLTATPGRRRDIELSCTGPVAVTGDPLSVAALWVAFPGPTARLWRRPGADGADVWESKTPAARLLKTAFFFPWPDALPHPRLVAFLAGHHLAQRRWDLLDAVLERVAAELFPPT